MNSGFFKKHLILAVLLLSCGANEVSARECCEPETCVRSCDYDDCNPVNCGCFNIQIQAGVAPIVWTRRGCFSVVSCNAASLTCNGNTPVGPVVPIFGMPSFNKLFSTPWTVGGKLGYALSECTELYFEANYRQANSKCFTSSTNLNLGLFIVRPVFQFTNVSKYKFYDFYVGLRRYWDACVCDRLSVFLGMQVGVAHHNSVRANITSSSLSNTCAAPFTACVPLFW